jgi:hypothetical protein
MRAVDANQLGHLRFVRKIRLSADARMCHFFEGMKHTFNSGCGFQARAILHIIGAAINQL